MKNNDVVMCNSYVEEYDDIFKKDAIGKAKRSKAYKATATNSEKDRRHGKKREVTRKEDDQEAYFYGRRGKKFVPLYKKENGKKGFVFNNDYEDEAV